MCAVIPSRIESPSPPTSTDPRQVEELRRQLSERDARIFDLEAASLATEAEADHRARRAEEEAARRVRSAEEELRRTRTEVERCRGGWVRQTKRAAELERRQQKRRREEGGGPEPERERGGAGGGNKWWGPPLHLKAEPPHAPCSSTEARRVTPGIGDEEDRRGDRGRSPARMEAAGEDDAGRSPTQAGGSKRKARRSTSNDSGVDAAAKDFEPFRPVGAGGTWNAAVVAGGSARRRLAWHLLRRDEMGRRSLPESDGADAATSSSSGAGIGASARRDAAIEAETRAFVRSILLQLAEAPEGVGVGTPAARDDDPTIAGLVRVLLSRFNSLFRARAGDDEGAADVDEDGDHAVGEGGDPIRGGNDGGVEPRGATASPRAALHLLRVLRDVLLLSGTARDDLRIWFYRSRQVGIGDGGRSGAGAGTGDAGGGDCPPRSRIEGLPPGFRSRRDDADRREALWTAGFRPNSAGRSDGWDPMMMARPCNDFFEALVGLMKGNVSAAETAPSNLESERTLVLVQIEAIDLVLALMSDAPPYDHAEGSRGNKTPYLWKFWWDALLPSYSVTQTATSREESPEESLSSAHPIGDFLSPWETYDIHGDRRLLGSGRKHSTRLLSSAPDDVSQQAKLSVRKQGRTSHRSSGGSFTSESAKENNSNSKVRLLRDNRKQQKQLSILVKSRILQLLSHFINCSSSISQSIHKKSENGGGRASLAKRILAAVLDDLDECIVPFLRSRARPSQLPGSAQDAENHLQLCLACLRFLSILSGSNEGIRMLRVQMRLESEPDEQSWWSQSAIGCVTSVLDGTLSFAKGIEEQGIVNALKSSDGLARALNAIVDQCVVFFQAILLFVQKQRRNSSSSKKATFLALISERRTVFQSCCRRILTNRSPSSAADPPHLLHFSEMLIYHVRYLFEEVAMDEEEDNRDG